MYYSEDLVEEVRSKNDIVDVIGSYVRLKKKGNSYFGLCPFHNEKSPSFSVSQGKQMYYCFGCGAGGNIFTFIMQYENYSFVEALQYLAERAGVSLPQVEPTQQQRRQADERARLLAVQKEAAKYYYVALRRDAGAPGYRYLTDRGLSEETMKKFGLGYAGKYSDGLYRYLKQRGYKDKLLADAGLVTLDERRGPADRFWNRVMFPIMDANHRVVGFGGRVMGDAKPKYLNSPETAIFDKSRTLYGLNFARTSRRKGMLLCEGYMDVIAMHQAGFDNAVASLGTAFTSGHASLIKRYTNEVLLLYDSDEAGTKAALRAIPILNEAGIVSRVVDLTPCKDPDEFLQKNGFEAFEQRLEGAVNSFLFVLRVLRRGYDLNDPQSKTAFYREIAGRLLSFQDELERQNYTEAAAREFHIGFEQLSRLVNSEGIRLGGVRPAARPKPTAEPEGRRREKEEGVRQAQGLLLTWLAEDERIFPVVSKYVSPADFQDPVYRQVAELLYAQHEEGSLVPARIISVFADDAQKQSEVAKLFHSPPAEGDAVWEKEHTLQEIICRVKELALRRMKEELNPADMQQMQRFIQMRNELDALRKTHISLDLG